MDFLPHNGPGPPSLVPGPHCPAKPSTYRVKVCTLSLPVTPHKGPQNQVRRNEGCAKWLDYHLSCTVGGMRPGRDSSGTLCPPAQALHSLLTAPCAWASCFSDWQEQAPAGPPAGRSAYPPACPVFYCDPQALKPPTRAPWASGIH
ncbi:hypothetical protein GHT09_012342 [Marmota monax]|uniref:Uncharacterized protein n=1 Tax=Marmota monax TaxID=9995 RepID=A0A834UYD4_MARMO|nr:hypothetical protein GHT09_012342 [Marmota monax]